MKLILVGKAASGKDHLKTKLRNKGFIAGVSHTTRPPRKGEVDGVDYHFIKEDEFRQMIKNNEFVEYMDFNGGLYGQTKDDFAAADVMIMSKEGLDLLPDEYRKQCIVIYLDIDRLTRIERLNHRKDNNDTMARRLQADEDQFRNFNDFEIRIKNSDF